MTGCRRARQAAGPGTTSTKDIYVRTATRCSTTPVQFHRAELLGVERQVFTRGLLVRIERLFPVSVGPARSADPDSGVVHLGAVVRTETRHCHRGIARICFAFVTYWAGVPGVARAPRRVMASGDCLNRRGLSCPWVPCAWRVVGGPPPAIDRHLPDQT
jgi:hypothetical protein